MRLRAYSLLALSTFAVACSAAAERGQREERDDDSIGVSEAWPFGDDDSNNAWPFGGDNIQLASAEPSNSGDDGSADNGGNDGSGDDSGGDDDGGDDGGGDGGDW
jgi:hypothetical protein